MLYMDKLESVGRHGTEIPAECEEVVNGLAERVRQVNSDTGPLESGKHAALFGKYEWLTAPAPKAFCQVESVCNRTPDLEVSRYKQHLINGRHTQRNSPGAYEKEAGPATASSAPNISPISFLSVSPFINFEMFLFNLLSPGRIGSFGTRLNA
jgi:hypothetical protein